MIETLKYDVIIIGAGLAGISVALRAKKKGYSVLVLEKNNRVGGKLETISKKGYRFDTGPSLFTEPHLVDELFELFDKKPSDYFKYVKYDEGCSYFFSNGKKISLSETKSIGIDKNDEDEVKKYLNSSLKDYLTLGKLFLEKPVVKPVEFLHPKYYKHYGYFTSLKMRSSLASYNKQSFSNPKLEQIFNRFGTYNGSNPYKMRGLFSMIPSLELKLGTYFPELGMRSIIDSIYLLAKQVGIDFHFNVENIEAVKIKNGFSLKTHIQLECSKLICSIDHITFYEKIFKDQVLLEKFKKSPRSSSGLVFYWGINTKIKELALHNILFNDEYKEEFDGLFETNKTVDHPTIYLHNSSVICPEDAPINEQTIFAMINIPANETISNKRREYYRNYIIDRIKKDLGADISRNIQFEEYQDNYKIQKNTGSYLGALYGANSNTLKAVTNRHPNTLKKHKNLFYCGGTVHPGGGIPLVLRSSKIVSELL